MSDETLSMSSRCGGTKRRKIKLNDKTIKRICNEVDIACGRRGAKPGSSTFKEQAKIMGSFAIILYDLQTDHLHRMED